MPIRFEVQGDVKIQVHRQCSNYRPGDVVTLGGLKVTKWNGKRAILVDKFKKKDGQKRWKVRVMSANNQEVVVKQQNMWKARSSFPSGTKGVSLCSASDFGTMFPEFIFGNNFDDFSSFTPLEDEVDAKYVHTECGCKIDSGYESPAQQLMDKAKDMNFELAADLADCIMIGDSRRNSKIKHDIYTCNLEEHWFVFGLPDWRNDKSIAEQEPETSSAPQDCTEHEHDAVNDTEVANN